jgi:predicted PhzF superfamily epimerase YddE/YHI9
VDAFTDSAFKGNPAAVCFLNDDNERDDTWLQSLAAEFNISETCFLIPITGFQARFSLRWFTPLAEVDLCGHATLASAHCLFSNGLVDSDMVEFVTRSGILTAKRVSDTSELSDGEVKGGTFLIELNFPVVTTCDVNLSDVSSSMITKALNGATIVDIKATATNNILVVLPSKESVTELQPRMDDILKCPCDGIIVTAAGSTGSSYDFYSRYFAPKFGVDEDPVCGSAHCALAHYWSIKMNKFDFLAYQVISLISLNLK